MEAFTPTDDATEGERVRYTAALESFVAPVSTPELVFVMTAVYTGTRKRRKAG